MGKYCADKNEVNRVKIWKNPREQLLLFNPLTNKNDKNLFKSIVMRDRIESLDRLSLSTKEEDLNEQFGI
jgi:hypothetical protein